jgi:hypothetical protein
MPASMRETLSSWAARQSLTPKEKSIPPFRETNQYMPPVNSLSVLQSSLPLFHKEPRLSFLWITLITLHPPKINIQGNFIILVEGSEGKARFRGRG